MPFFFSFLKTNADFMIITMKHVQHHDQWVFLTFSHFHEHGFHHFCSLKYPRFVPTYAELFFFFFNFLVNWCVGNWNIFDNWYYHWYCIVIVSQSSSMFVYSKAWEKLVFLLALNISNIVIGLMEIIQLTCMASWLAGFCIVFTCFTWYISDE